MVLCVLAGYNIGNGMLMDKIKNGASIMPLSGVEYRCKPTPPEPGK